MLWNVLAREAPSPDSGGGMSSLFVYLIWTVVALCLLVSCSLLLATFAK
jgi:hypothetical protein